MSMTIAVFLKQVPDNTKLKFNDAGPVLDGIPMMLNPYDEYALETALKIKEAAGSDAQLVALSLAAPSAKEILKKAIAVGADSAFLINNEAVANDSTVSATVLAEAVKSLVPNVSLLVFGQASLDEADGQTGLKVAELLDRPSLTYCKNAELKDGTIVATRETERGYETHQMTLPGVLCIMKCDYELRGSNIKGVMKANKTEIPVKTVSDLGLDASATSDSAAVVKILKSWQRPAKTGAKMIDGSNAQAGVSALVDALKIAKVL